MAMPHHAAIGNNSHGGRASRGESGISFIRSQIRATAHRPGRSFHLGLWGFKKNTYNRFPTGNLVLSAIIMSSCLGNNAAVIRALLIDSESFPRRGKGGGSEAR